MPNSFRLVLITLLVLGSALVIYRDVYIARKVAAAEGSVTWQKEWPREQNSDVILFGDSRISMWEPLPASGKLRVISRGIGGQTTAQMLKRFKADVIDLHPKTVVIEAGINDLVASGLSPSNQDRFQRAVAGNLRAMCELASAAGIKVVLLKIIPSSRVPFWRWLFWSDRIPQLIEETNKELAKIPGVELVDPAVALLPNGDWEQDFIADELHITPEAYRSLNALVEPHL